MHKGDQAEGNRNGDGMGIYEDMRQPLKKLEALDKVGHHRLTYPAQGQTDHGDAELYSVDNFIEVAMESLQDSRPDTSGFDQLLNARVTHAYQSEFSRGEKGICRHQEDNQEDPEQHKGYHLPLILTFQRCWMVWRLGPNEG